MKTLYYDCTIGISGDMHLGAMLDLGVDETYLKKELSKLGLDHAFTLETKKDIKNGVTGTKVNVVLTDDTSLSHPHTHPSHHHTHEDVHRHKHGHDDDDHHHPSHEHDHHHRTYKVIKEMISKSGLSQRVKEMSLKIFYEIAVSEAKVHGKTLDEVHFHEVGAIDSIVDIVGAAICIDALKVDRILSSPVQLGGGFVWCAHGKIPVPAPATTEILKGIPIELGLVASESTTPTGAAILKALVDRFEATPHMTITSIGYGLGTKTFEVPNVLRVFLGESETKVQAVTQVMIETNIDDMNPEFYQHVEGLLFENGALDVFITPITMKKGRPAVKLSVLCHLSDQETLEGILFTETTSIGLRSYLVQKTMLQRQMRQVETPYGPVPVKEAYYQGKRIKSKPEYEVCQALAKANHVSLHTVYETLKRSDDYED